MKKTTKNKKHIIGAEKYIGILERYIDSHDTRISMRGLLEDEVSKIFDDKKILSTFNTWMYGQTAGFDNRLGMIYYCHDVYRFIRTLRGHITYWD